MWMGERFIFDIVIQIYHKRVVELIKSFAKEKQEMPVSIFPQLVLIHSAEIRVMSRDKIVPHTGETYFYKDDAKNGTVKK